GWAVFFFLLAIFVAAFFRDPERLPPSEPGAVVSPADGRVIAIEDPPGGGKLIGIFLAVYDVHINRSPVAGIIEDTRYRPGKFLAAFHQDAARVNEQNAIDIRTDSGENFRVVQIAGVIARRIVSWRRKGDTLAKGERLGLIQFGSRTDLHLPPDYEVSIVMGERVRGGETILARPSQR
ncbi:phosphatidylserine decarboxylase, partial [Nitrospinota bacterium]